MMENGLVFIHKGEFMKEQCATASTTFVALYLATEPWAGIASI
jgi:hypothetical protein